MAEYIEREAVLAEYDRQHQGPPGGARKIIAEWPAADVAPVRHGHWIGTEYDGYADGNPVYTLFECSECGIEYEQEEHYCPWCGAKMDGDNHG